MSKLQPLVFRAAIRQTQNAISLGSNGEGGILQFELPESEIASNLLADLMKLRKTELIVTVLPAQAVSAAVAADTLAEGSPAGGKSQEGAFPAKSEASGKEPKGPFGNFAGHLYGLGFYNHPEIKMLIHKWRATYDAESEQDAIYRAFGVVSRAEIGPVAWREVLEREVPSSDMQKTALQIVNSAERRAMKEQ